jgi:ATP-dependent Lon protease
MISTNNDCMPRVICLQGQAGVGKTSFIRNGISKILNRPFKHINMGGICDGDYLIGHESTYVGSKPGMIVNSLIESKVMNPIIFMDEVDKISNSEKGIDVQSVLIHLTDPVQNSDFQDKYFGGLKIDLSKVLFVFSCNDETKISPILRDRLNIIRVKTPSLNEKVIIGKDYLLKEICPNIGFDINSVKIEADTVKHIITNYCKDDAGVRGIKKILETLLLKINSAIYNPLNKYKSLKNVKLSTEEPFEITTKLVEEVIKKNEDKYSELMNSMFL